MQQTLQALSLVVCALWPTTAMAGCEARLERVRDATLLTNGGYDGFLLGDTIEVFPIEIRHVDGGPCQVILTFTSAGSDQREMTGQGDQLAYQIQTSTRVSDVIPNTVSALESDLLSFDLEPGDEVIAEYFIYVPAGQIVRSGQYTDQIVIGLHELNGIARELVDEREIEATIEASSRFEINVSGGSNSGGTSATVDFGVLESGEKRKVLLQARSSDDYVLKLSSANGGILQHEAGDWGVDYVTVIDQDNVSFSGGDLVTRLSRSGPTSLRGDTVEVDLIIGDISRKPAGQYSDTITIEMRPR